jgi:hypothetical protein
MLVDHPGLHSKSSGSIVNGHNLSAIAERGRTSGAIGRAGNVNPRARTAATAAITSIGQRFLFIISLPNIVHTSFLPVLTSRDNYTDHAEVGPAFQL